MSDKFSATIYRNGVFACSVDDPVRVAVLASLRVGDTVVYHDHATQRARHSPPMVIEGTVHNRWVDVARLELCIVVVDEDADPTKVVE